MKDPDKRTAPSKSQTATYFSTIWKLLGIIPTWILECLALYKVNKILTALNRISIGQRRTSGANSTSDHQVWNIPR